MTFALYTGCTPKVAEPELLKSAYALAEHLGWDFIEKREFTCCGGSHLQDADDDETMFINLRNLAYAEQDGLDVVTLCNTCQFVISDFRQRALSSPEKMDEINKSLGRHNLSFSGKSRVIHFLYALIETLGYEGIASRVVKPLTGLKVASFYGCHNIRPSGLQTDVNLGENSWKPRSLDRLVEALGGEPVYFPEADSCCGFHTSLYSGRISGKLSGLILKQAFEMGADVMITPCPLCHTNLDAAQYEARREVGLGFGFPLPIPRFIRSSEFTPGFIKEDFDLPILHFEQLIGLSWGLDRRQLGMNHNIISWRKNRRLRNLVNG